MSYFPIAKEFFLHAAEACEFRATFFPQSWPPPDVVLKTVNRELPCSITIFQNVTDAADRVWGFTVS